ncbi:hypothetical protein ANN_22134 [Periplaneta americana]|uniref:Uncharacterized protein n=1 Tax=Periplaneta americana TaxID=6978 RepID=A0ABQ8S862_PERAM|nr:hypothetical protein ANN_22134 [Periplaneta americana]
MEHWTDRIRNEAMLERVGEERMMLKLIRKRKGNLLGHWLRRNCLLKDALEGMVNGRRVQGPKFMNQAVLWQQKLSDWPLYSRTYRRIASIGKVRVSYFATVMGFVLNTIIVRAVASRSKASRLGLALRNVRWFESSCGKKLSHEISASLWDRCLSSIVMHLGSYDRQRKSGFRKPAITVGWIIVPPFWLDDRPPLLRHVDVRPAAGWSVLALQRAEAPWIYFY